MTVWKDQKFTNPKDYNCTKCGLLNTEFDYKANKGKCFCGGELEEIKQ